MGGVNQSMKYLSIANRQLGAIMTMSFLNLNEVEAIARGVLPKPVFDYFRGGSEGETTLQENATSFSRLKLLPRILRNVSCVSMSTRFLGKGTRMPCSIHIPQYLWASWMP